MMSRQQINSKQHHNSQSDSTQNNHTQSTSTTFPINIKAHPLVQKYNNELIELRRYLHSTPELSFKLVSHHWRDHHQHYHPMYNHHLLIQVRLEVCYI